MCIAYPRQFRVIDRLTARAPSDSTRTDAALVMLVVRGLIEWAIGSCTDEKPRYRVHEGSNTKSTGWRRTVSQPEKL